MCVCVCVCVCVCLFVSFIVCAQFVLYVIRPTIVVIIDNCCLALFSGPHKLTVLYNIFKHFQTLCEKNMKGNTFKKLILIYI